MFACSHAIREYACLIGTHNNIKKKEVLFAN